MGKPFGELLTMFISLPRHWLIAALAEWGCSFQTHWSGFSPPTGCGKDLPARSPILLHPALALGFSSLVVVVNSKDLQMVHSGVSLCTVRTGYD
jgi:hypothetical protein